MSIAISYDRPPLPAQLNLAGASELSLPAEAHHSEGRSVPLNPNFAVSHRHRKKGKDSKTGKVALPTMEGFCFEKVKHIAYLEAGGNYTVLHFEDGRQVLVCKTLCDMEQMLPRDAFVRIHRSHTIHLRHIKKYVRGKGGHVVLQNGVTLTVSAGQKETFMEALKNYF